MINLKMFLVVAALVSITACENGSKYDGLILTDENTGKKYLLEYNVGDTYFVEERVIVINGQDTTYQFR